MGWGDWKRRFHEPKEDEYSFVKRLGRTPPEFWTGRERMESRILRAKARRYEDKLRREGKNRNRLYQRYPEGPFWPHTPNRDERWRRDVQANGRYAWELENGFQRTYGYPPDAVYPPEWRCQWGRETDPEDIWWQNRYYQPQHHGYGPYEGLDDPPRHGYGRGRR